MTSSLHIVSAAASSALRHKKGSCFLWAVLLISIVLVCALALSLSGRHEGTVSLERNEEPVALTEMCDCEPSLVLDFVEMGTVRFLLVPPSLPPILLYPYLPHATLPTLV